MGKPQAPTPVHLWGRTSPGLCRTLETRTPSRPKARAAAGEKMNEPSRLNFRGPPPPYLKILRPVPSLAADSHQCSAAQRGRGGRGPRLGLYLSAPL